MFLPWHQGAKTPEKLCSVIVLLLALTAIFSFFSNFSPSEFTRRYSLYASLVLAALIFFPSLSMMRKLPSRRLYQKIAFGVLWFGLLFGMMYFSLTAGIPSIVVKYAGQEFTHEGAVTWKNGGRSRGCDYKIEVNGYDNTFFGSICVTDKIWNAVEVGQPIVLVGKELIFGRRVLAVLYETADNSLQDDAPPAQP